MILARHGQAWLVGGWVRDHLLGEETHDIDFVVPRGAVATARQLATAVGGAFVLLDEERDTARVLVGQPWEALYLDVAGLRAPNIEQDLLERDFTVNAMAAPAAEWRAPDAALIDPTGGRVDLERRMLRAVSEESFRADPLRLLRAVRLSAALAFDLESPCRSSLCLRLHIGCARWNTWGCCNR
jgi:tRNA nucleotidyltransferase/poly(A) polymerase